MRTTALDDTDGDTVLVYHFTRAWWAFNVVIVFSTHSQAHCLRATVVRWEMFSVQVVSLSFSLPFLFALFSRKRRRVEVWECGKARLAASNQRPRITCPRLRTLHHRSIGGEGSLWLVFLFLSLSSLPISSFCSLVGVVLNNYHDQGSERETSDDWLNCFN